MEKCNYAVMKIFFTIRDGRNFSKYLENLEENIVRCTKYVPELGAKYLDYLKVRFRIEEKIMC